MIGLTCLPTCLAVKERSEAKQYSYPSQRAYIVSSTQQIIAERRRFDTMPTRIRHSPVRWLLKQNERCECSSRSYWHLDSTLYRGVVVRVSLTEKL